MRDREKEREVRTKATILFFFESLPQEMQKNWERERESGRAPILKYTFSVMSVDF